jgi:two-component system chemotaxis response regulator CheB
VEMPKMDGITFLSNLMRLRPMPVVMISSLTTQGADVTLKALELGAVDFISKPQFDLAEDLANYASEITTKVKTAARARVRAPRPAGTSGEGQKLTFTRQFKTTDKLIAIGASTGGTEAVREVLEVLPATSPAVVVAQHIPEMFSGRFADRLNACCALKVREAQDGEHILPGNVYIAPGSHHLEVVRSGARFLCRLNDGALVNRHRPSVDVLFDSVASNCGSNAVGLILTGMGADGARGLRNMRDLGAHTIAQDEATSVVWGMPGEAVKRDAVEQVLPLNRVAAALLRQF